MIMILSRLKIFLQLVAIAHILGGIFLPLLVNSPLFATYNTLLYQALGAETTVQNSAINFLMGLFGPTIASWGVLFLYVVSTAFKNPDPKGWWVIFLSCIVWALRQPVVHSAEIPINAFINLVSAFAILIPLFMARKHFFQSENPTQ
jgi:hypothetical protein